MDLFFFSCFFAEFVVCSDDQSKLRTPSGVLQGKGTSARHRTSGCRSATLADRRVALKKRTGLAHHEGGWHIKLERQASFGKKCYPFAQPRAAFSVQRTDDLKQTSPPARQSSWGNGTVLDAPSLARQTLRGRSHIMHAFRTAGGSKRRPGACSRKPDFRACPPASLAGPGEF